MRNNNFQGRGNGATAAKGAGAGDHVHRVQRAARVAHAVVQKCVVARRVEQIAGQGGAQLVGLLAQHDVQFGLLLE